MEYYVTHIVTYSDLVNLIQVSTRLYSVEVGAGVMVG
jgi:hypothetical protein